MSSAIKTKKRIIEAVIAVLVIALAATGGGYLIAGSINSASAAEETEVGNIAGLTNAFRNGGSYRLTADIMLENKIDVPVTADVTLNLNSHSIYWDDQRDGTGESIMATSYSEGSYAEGRYWGLITIESGGSLNLTGSGTVRNKQITTGMNAAEMDNYVQRLAAIVNRGSLTIGPQVTVSAYCSNVDQGGNYKDAFIYCMGVYNNGGTVNTEGTINSGSMVSSGSGDTNSYHYAICYGIYEGTVNTNGGSINVNAYSGAYKIAYKVNRKNNHMVEIAVGVFSTEAKILGNTDINCNTITWQGQSNYDCWGSDGLNIMVSAGVMYLKGVNNYPVIGSGVDVSATYKMNDNEHIEPPGADGFSGGYDDLHCNDDGPRNFCREARAVVGVPWNEYTDGQHTDGEHTFEHEVDGTRRGFFGNILTEEVDSSHKYSFDGWESYYRPEESYEKYPNKTDLVDNYLVSADASNIHAAVRKETGAARQSIFQNGTPGTEGGQFITVYRFYENAVDPDNLYDIKFDDKDGGITSVVNTLGYCKTGDVPNYSGYVENANTKLSWGGGADIKNKNLYELASTTVENVETRDYANRIKDADHIEQWKATGSAFTADTSVMIGNGHTDVIYINIVKKAASMPRVAVGDDASPNNENTAFTVVYTSNALVAGEDFKLQIFDMGGQYSIETNYTDDDTNVTNQYNVSGTGTGVGVAYKYVESDKFNGADTEGWRDGLPKDAGEYTIAVELKKDETGNRVASTQYITCTIEKATPDITGSPSVTGKVYGEPLSSYILLSGYAAVSGNGNDVDLNNYGSIAYEGHAPEEYLNAGSHNITITWTPNPGTDAAKNYNSASLTVNLEVGKKTAYVWVVESHIGFGEDPSTLSWRVGYSGLAPRDNDKRDAWKANSKIQIQVENEWVDYTASTPKGIYPAEIKDFGGKDDPNYNFNINENESGSADGKLVVDKKAVHYVAAGIDRPYDPSSNAVEVTLTYVSGLIGADQDNVKTPITVQGNVGDDKDAGNGKPVTVDLAALTSDQTGYSMESYEPVLDNDPTVNITKADPTGVSCKAQYDYFGYESTHTLANHVSLVKEGDNVKGEWSWLDGSIVPTCDVSEYTAVFTPKETNNYNTITQKVKINVAQKEVKITVPDDAKTIYYGDPAPAMGGVITYNGFTGKDTIDSVPHTGNISVVIRNAEGKEYKKGSPAGDYTIHIESSLESVNYKFATEDATLTVARRPLTITPKDKTITYYDQIPQFNPAADLTADGFYTEAHDIEDFSGTANITTDYTQGASAGVYDIMVSDIEAPNYNITFEKGKLYVEKAALTVSLEEGNSVPYGTDPTNIKNLKYVLNGFKNSDNKDNINLTGEPVFYTTGYSKISKPGEYAVIIETSNMSSTNYAFTAADNQTFTVTKADVTVNPVPSAEVYEGQTYADATWSGDYTFKGAANGSPVQGDLTLDNGDTLAKYNSESTIIKVPATFTPTGEEADCYNLWNGNVNLHILQATAEGKPVITGVPKVSETLTADVSYMKPGSPDSYDFQWYKNDAEISGATGQTYQVKADDLDADITVKATPKTDSGYIAEGEYTSDAVKIVDSALLIPDKTLFSVTLPQNLEYDGEPKTARVDLADPANKGKVGDFTVKYNNSATDPVDAGTYVVTVDIAAPADMGDGLYSPMNGLVLGEFTITPKQITAQVAAEDKVYDGRKTSYNSTVDLVGVVPGDAEFVSIAPGYVISFSQANVGENLAVTAENLKLQGEKAGNYAVTVTPDSASITKRTLKAIAYVNTPVEYTGSNQFPIRFGSIEGYASGDNAATVYFNEFFGASDSAEHGSRQVIPSGEPTLGGVSAGNYEPVVTGLDNLTVQILKAVPAPGEVTIDGGVYNPNKTLGNLTEGLRVESPVAGHWEFKDPQTVPTVDVTHYPATFYPDNENYGNVDGYVTVNIQPLQVTITANDKTITYGQPAPAFDVTVTDGIDINDIPGAGISFSCEYVQGVSKYGKYRIHLECSFDDDNYDFITVDGWLTVEKAHIIITASALNKQYDGNADITVNFAITEGKPNGCDVALSNVSTTGTASSPNAGTVTVTYASPTLTGDDVDSVTYEVVPASGALTAEITKVPADNVVFPSGGVLQFGYNLTHVTFKNPGSGDGRFVYENAENIVPDRLGVFDGYYLEFIPNDPVNYESKKQIVAFTVEELRVDFAVTINGTLQPGNTLTLSYKNLPSAANKYLRYQWYRIEPDGNEPPARINGATGATYQVQTGDVGYIIAVVVYLDKGENQPVIFAESAYKETLDNNANPDDNYVGIVGETTEVIKKVRLSFWQTLLDWLYKIISAISNLILGLRK